MLASGIGKLLFHVQRSRVDSTTVQRVQACSCTSFRRESLKQPVGHAEPRWTRFTGNDAEGSPSAPRAGAIARKGLAEARWSGLTAGGT